MHRPSFPACSAVHETLQALAAGIYILFLANMNIIDSTQRQHRIASDHILELRPLFVHCLDNKTCDTGITKLVTQGERERDLLQVPHFFVGTLQPL